MGISLQSKGRSLYMVHGIITALFKRPRRMHGSQVVFLELSSLSHLLLLGFKQSAVVTFAGSMVSIRLPFRQRSFNEVCISPQNTHGAIYLSASVRLRTVGIKKSPAIAHVFMCRYCPCYLSIEHIILGMEPHLRGFCERAR